MSGWDKHPEYGGPPVRWWDYIVWPLVIVLIAFGIFQCSTQSQAQEREIIGVASVIDGDTIEIHGEHIRLWGFDAPERGRRCAGGVSAKQVTSNALDTLIAGRTVRCAVRDTDRHGRPVAMCRAGETELGAWMVEQGWARDWPRYSNQFYAPQETRARAAGRGLWAMQCPNLWGNRSYAP
ncbi:MAG: thermonuclease family protein [Hydrogenophilaceae bacterium]|nr:thermonuclease family protein [Hydrogenophilaceae bacterium]